MRKTNVAEAEQRAEAWVFSVDMGLGHQRAVYPFRSIAHDGIQPVGADPQEAKLWRNLRRGYEFLSRIRNVPLVGKPLFGVLDTFQNIPPFYPFRNMANPSPQVKLIDRLIDRGMGAGMIEAIRAEPFPLLTSYPVPALAADKAGYPRIYCIVCDAEISRAWVAVEPRKSRINYLAPCGRAVMRLRSYGVPDDRIYLTGFPMPGEATGGPDLDVLKHDMAHRLNRLDPENRFWPLHERNVQHFLGARVCRAARSAPSDPVAITFAVGGAGAQKEIGRTVLESLRSLIADGSVTLNLVAGVRPEVRDYFEEARKEILPNADGVSVLFREEKSEYFHAFAELLRATDVLWTKPSELSFMSGLGIPIIMAPTIGSQEEYNRRWLLEIQAGIPQEDPRFTHQWLMDLRNEGRLAEAAWDGFLKARKYGTFKTIEVIETGTMRRETDPLRR